MGGMIRLYQNALQRRPYLVQAIQTGLLMGAGDIIAQKMVEKSSTLNMKRTLQFASIGFFVGGPALRKWYGILNDYIGSKGKVIVVKKVLVDQLLFAPLFLGILLASVGVTQGKPLNSIKSELEANYFDVLKANYYIWPWVQLANFYFVPLQFQVLIAQIVALFWNTYISWKTNKEKSIS